MLLVHCEVLFISLSFQTCSNPFTCLTAQISGAVKYIIYSHAASGNPVIYFQPAAKELSLFFPPTSCSVKEREYKFPVFPLTMFGNLHTRKYHPPVTFFQIHLVNFSFCGNLRMARHGILALLNTFLGSTGLFNVISN